MSSSKLQPLSTHSEGVLSWTVLGPKQLFPLPRNRCKIIQFQFIIKNNVKTSRRVKVQLESPSPILKFRKAQPKRMSRSRIYAKITALSHTIEQSISANAKATYDFPAEYAPYLTPHLPAELILYFGIFVFDENDEIQNRFGPRKITLPIGGGGSPMAPVDEYTI